MVEGKGFNSLSPLRSRHLKSPSVQTTPKRGKARPIRAKFLWGAWAETVGPRLAGVVRSEPVFNTPSRPMEADIDKWLGWLVRLLRR
jgi:hypothetical protein